MIESIGGRCMRKPAVLFLLIVSLGLIFGGAAFAVEPTVNVTVLDENAVPVETAHPGDEVSVYVEASANNETIQEPRTLINIDPENGFTLDTEHAVMWNGTQWISNNNTEQGGFLTWSDQDGAWFWAIMEGFGPMQPGDMTQLIIPAEVTAVGNITTNVIFEDGILEETPVPAEETFVPATDSYTFLSVGSEPVNAETVPMQSTGTPVAIAALGLLAIIGGSVYGRIR
jgi:hypothetical protein